MYPFAHAIFLIRILAGLCFFVVFLIPSIFYILTLTRALDKCSPGSRTMQPGTLWLLLIPFVNLIWNFFVVMGMANSLGNEFRMRNIPAEPEPGKSIGLAMSVCGACTVIPILGLLAALASLILWIMYWVRIAEFSHMLDVAPYYRPAPYIAPGM